MQMATADNFQMRVLDLSLPLAFPTNFTQQVNNYSITNQDIKVIHQFYEGIPAPQQC